MAYYFQSYLQASSMPKRLLQYALSRLEILETDALDLENLDIAWGKNSTFEFRDVGLRLKKLEDILKLPPSLELNKARIVLLRLTIPVDIYSSPIVVAVDGVEGQLRVNSKSENSTTPASRTDHDRNRRRSHSARHGTENPGTGSGSGRRGPDFTDDDELDPALPTAADLAESFLQAEPEQDRAELEAAMLSETQELGTASVMSEDGELPVGTGTPLSLPGFMTTFLQGIVDRLEVRIQGITVNLDIDIPGESSNTSISNSTDPVTIQLKIDSVDIEGVTHDLEIPSTEGEGDGKRLKHKDGKRLISLSKIRGALISEANLFSSLGRSSAMSSPSAAHSDISDRKSMLRSSSTRASTLRTVDQTYSDHGSITSSRRLSGDTGELHSLRASTIASDAGRFDNASEDGEASNLSASLRDSLSEAGDSIFQNSAYLDELADSQFSDEEGSRARDDSLPSAYFHNIQSSDGPSTPKASTRIPSLPEGELKDMETGYFDSGNPTRSVSHAMLQSTVLPMRPHSRFSADRVSRSQPLLSTGRSQIPSAEIASSCEDVEASAREDEDDINESSGDEETATPVATDDLTKSQLFSHEDAESMYMSAISHASLAGKVPGGWSNSSGDSDGPPTKPGSPASPQIRKDSRDNLEFAREHPATESPIPKAMQRSSSPLSESIRKSKISYSPTSTHKRNNPSLPHISSGVSERSNTSSDDYSRLTKQVLNLDRIDIYIPTTFSNSEDLSNGLATSPADDQHNVSQSTSVNIPGSFSTHIHRKQAQAPTPSSPVKQPATEPKMNPQNKDTAVEVAMGRLLTQFDISIGRLIFKIVYQLQELLKQEPSNPHQSKTNLEKLSPGTNPVNFKLCVEKISLMFLERLEGTLGSAHTVSDASNSVGQPETDILLRTTINGLKVNSHATQSSSNTTITVQKFALGYSQESIVSFDAGLQMRASVRDLKASDGVDLRVNLSKKDGTSRCEIITLPVHISIDLQRLDDTFSWFGGLSSVLNLGSSIASNATITATNPGKPKTRGVRFEAPIKPDDSSQVAQNKADIRLGGLILDLVGTECSIGVETSAIKAVNRDEGMGIFIQAIRLSGPHIRHSNDEPAIIADIASTRIEYLPSPKDTDLDRLLSLITPSKAQYDQDDDILLDTLLRQRKLGAVLRLTVEDFQVHMNKLDEFSYLPNLGEEVSRLSTVAKYLPDDDRPGLLSLVVVRKLGAHIDVNSTLGSIQLSSTDIEVAHITLPSLVALSVGSVQARRNASEELIGAATDLESRESRARSPAVMARMIGDEMEPVVRIKLWNLRVEYRVPTLMTFLGLVDGATTQDISAGLAESVATLTNFARSRATKEAQTFGSSTSKSMALDVVVKDCILGLNPANLPSKLLAVLTEGHLTAILPKDKKTTASMELSKASLLIIDNVANIISGDVIGAPRRQSFDGGSSQVADLCTMGFVSVSYVSSAKAVLVVNADDDGEQCIDVEFRDDLFVLETCADSTQTLISILNSLAPPSAPSKETKYRTKVIPVEDLLASLSGNAFGTAEGDYNFDDDFGIEGSESDELGEEYDELGFDSHFYQQGSEVQDSEAAAKGLDDLPSSAQLGSRDTHDGVLLDSFVEPDASLEERELEFHENHFGTGSVLEGTAHRWNSVKNTYDRSNTPRVRKSPLKICVRDMHIIWNLFDGYDWQNTRDTITKAVQDVESKAIEKRARNERRSTFDQDIEDEETVIGDFLFNSIYIGIPANRDPRELTAAINQELNDNATETESLATTTHSSSPSRQGGARKLKPKKLRLNRSKHHKITFELRGVNVDFVTFPPGTGETQSSVDVRVHDFEIFDHIPSSTWRKFATYMQDAGERETGSSMIHIELLNVKPIPNLAAAEIVLKVTVLPLRLHVDQDALDFITRFFEFKSNSTPVQPSPSDVPFIQRAEVNSVQVKLDFKPKRVDYAGLRSGHTTEFMNFLILDEADMVLRHTIIYGISGFDKLGNCLNDIWMPDVKRNQLPGILAGLAPVRSLVNVGGGFQHLVTVPVREYQKDGRIVRSISKGATAFAKTTGTELVKLGAKVAIGVQTVLQSVEDVLGPTMETSKVAAEDVDSEEEDIKHISPYANQPVGVLQGLRGGYTGLQRDLVLARDAIIAVPGEAMEGGNAAGLLRAVRKHAPTVILRPAIGVAKAGGQFLMGATNSLDPVNLQRADAKYKKH